MINGEDVGLIIGFIAFLILWHLYGFKEVLNMLLSTLASGLFFYFIIRKALKLKG
jgi:hypothetical protein